MLDTSKVSGFADYFLLCSGDSERQIRAIQDEIEGVLKKAGARPFHLEGTADSGWLLLDYGDVIIHIFAPAQRQYYGLDELWSAATPILRIQ